jgi:hypothetical protein
VFAKWKPFSSSAVASSIGHSEIPATTLAAAPSALLRAPREQPSETSSPAEHRCAGSSSAPADELSDQARPGSELAENSSRPTRA